MKRVKIFILTFVVLMFAVSSVISTQRNTQVTDILTHSMKTVGWTASELELEMLKFIQALRRTALNDMGAEDLQLRFELLWSRIGVLSVGEETREFRSQPGAIELLRNIKQRLVEIESEVLNLKMGEQNAIRIAQELKPLQTQVREFNIRSFSGDRAWAGLKHVYSLQNDANIFLFGLLLSGSILIFLVIRESAVNRKQALHDSLTGLANRHFFQYALEKTITNSQRNMQLEMRCFRRSHHV
ncbi:hypothetical protein ACPSKX_15010 [Moritella viscosa]